MTPDTVDTVGPADSRLRRVARWRTALVSSALTATIGLSSLIGLQVAADATETPAVVTTDDSSATTPSTSSDRGSSSGVSSGSSSSYDATSGGS